MFSVSRSDLLWGIRSCKSSLISPQRLSQNPNQAKRDSWPSIWYLWFLDISQYSKVTWDPGPSTLQPGKNSVSGPERRFPEGLCGQEMWCCRLIQFQLCIDTISCSHLFYSWYVFSCYPSLLWESPWWNHSLVIRLHVIFKFIKKEKKKKRNGLELNSSLEIGNKCVIYVETSSWLSSQNTIYQNS